MIPGIKAVVSAEDRYLDPPSHDYLEAIGRQKAGTDFDIRLVKDGKVLWSGGLFSGWKEKPSLHGTWDGLSILNSLFKYYPVRLPCGITVSVALFLLRFLAMHGSITRDPVIYGAEFSRTDGSWAKSRQCNSPGGTGFGTPYNN